MTPYFKDLDKRRTVKTRDFYLNQVQSKNSRPWLEDLRNIMLIEKTEFAKPIKLTANKTNYY